MTPQEAVKDFCAPENCAKYRHEKSLQNIGSFAPFLFIIGFFATLGFSAWAIVKITLTGWSPVLGFFVPMTAVTLFGLSCFSFIKFAQKRVIPPSYLQETCLGLMTEVLSKKECQDYSFVFASGLHIGFFEKLHQLLQKSSEEKKYMEKSRDLHARAQHAVGPYVPFQSKSPSAEESVKENIENTVIQVAEISEDRDNGDRVLQIQKPFKN